MMKKLLLLLFLPLLAWADLPPPVKYGEMLRTAQAIQYNCLNGYCYLRVHYYFIKKDVGLLTCIRLLNQPINTTGGWTTFMEYVPSADMTATPLSQAETDWCNQP
jgi:hypothetical protein